MSDPADHYAHAKFLALGLAGCRLQEKALILGAFLGHEACKLVVTENMRLDGVVFKDKLIRNIEINEFLDGLLTWGYAITHRASLGVVKLLASAIKNDNSASRDTKGLIKAMSNLIEDPKDNDKLQILNDTVKNRNFYIYDRRSKEDNLASAIGLITGSIVRNRSGVKPLKAAAIHFHDEAIKDAVRSEVYPFILGEFA